MGHGNTQNMLMAIMSEAQVFTPLKEVIKLNILQYQQDATIYNQQEGKQVQVKPVDLRKTAVHFKVSDGLQPSDKMIASDEFQTFFQVVGSSPAVANGYNLPPMVSYMMKTRGLDLRPFEKSQLQMQYEQQLQAWQQAAAMAAKAGTEFKVPMPQIPPELKNQPAVQISATGQALEATQGNS
jgi:hypothetical protein